MIKTQVIQIIWVIPHLRSPYFFHILDTEKMRSGVLALFFQINAEKIQKYGNKEIRKCKKFPPHFLRISVFLLSRFFRISDTEIRNAEIWNFAKNKLSQRKFELIQIFNFFLVHSLPTLHIY